MLFIYRTNDTDQKIFSELPLLNDTADFIPQSSFKKISTRAQNHCHVRHSCLRFHLMGVVFLIPYLFEILKEIRFFGFCIC